jgi:hypothetical protein
MRCRHRQWGSPTIKMILEFYYYYSVVIMHDQGTHSEKRQKHTPDVYSLLSWKDTTSLCEYDTFDEYLKAECKQLICVNQTLKNKIKSQEASIEYLLKTIETKDTELEKISSIMKREQNSKTIKKGSMNEFGNLLTAGMLSKSINQEFSNDFLDYSAMV